MEILFAKKVIAGGADAEGSVASGPAGLALDGTRAVQVDEFIQGDHPEFIDRQNKATTISFSVVRQHESYGDAEIFCLTHAEDLPVIGDLVFRGALEDGGVLQRIARNAALVGVKSVHSAGVRTEHSYQFMFGELQKGKL